MCVHYCLHLFSLPFACRKLYSYVIQLISWVWGWVERCYRQKGLALKPNLDWQKRTTLLKAVELKPNPGRLDDCFPQCTNILCKGTYTNLRWTKNRETCFSLCFLGGIYIYILNLKALRKWQKHYFIMHALLYVL